MPKIDKYTPTTDEERLAVVMNQVGPFVAISETDRGKTDFGAARLSVSDDEWENVVLRLIESAQLIVIRVDPLTEKWGSFFKETHQYNVIKGRIPTLKVVPEPNDFNPTDLPESVWWEIEQAISINPQRTLFYLPFKGKNIQREAIYEDIAQRLQKFVKARLPDKLGGAEFIGFGPDGTPYVMHNKGMRMFGIVNLYGKILEPCFQQLGVHSTRISIDYYRFVEVILNLTFYLLIFVMGAMVFLYFILESFTK